MAENDNNPGNIRLTVNDMLGIIQRQLAELNAYISQAPQSVDKAVVLAYLMRANTFAERLPERPAQQDAQQRSN